MSNTSEFIKAAVKVATADLKAELNRTKRALDVAMEALKFMTMPLTGTNSTVESLKETIATDIEKGNKALKQIDELMGEK